MAFGTAFFPNIRLHSFAPFFALAYNRKSLMTSLWIAALCGIAVDLLCSQLKFGLYSLNYCLTTLLSYRQKKHFFEDKPLALSLFTALISGISTLIQLLLTYAFDQGLPFTWKLALTDLIGMPCIDALYAFVWFSCPMQAYVFVKRGGLRLLWHRIKILMNLSS
jgi:rod shape-determining protein MreD